MRTLLTFGLAWFAIMVILPERVHAQSSTITCEPYGLKNEDGTYSVYAKGSYTYTSSPPWVVLRVDDELGTLDKDGKFVKVHGPFTANKLDKDKKTWQQDVQGVKGQPGASLWVRAVLYE